MIHLAKFDEDEELRIFLQQLLNDKCLINGAERFAQKLLEHGLDGIDAEERAFIETEVIEPYYSSCEDCGKTPNWADMLDTYDTGLCKACFKKATTVKPPVLDVA